MNQPTKQPLSGFLNVLKPPGMSSAHVVGVVRRLFDGVKVGHAGTLDPEAAGVLPLMIGKAARLFDYMQEKEKAYVTEVAFGVSTDTQDAQGIAMARGDQFPTQAQIENALTSFRGTIQQTPPMFSALSVGGERLYHLARQGKQIDIPSREVTVHRLELFDVMPNQGARLVVSCSKGFYVRTLCHDLGEKLGCPAHMRFLLRVKSGVFDLSTAKTLEMLTEAKESGTLQDMLLPPEVVLSHLPSVEVPKRYRKHLLHGKSIDWQGLPSLHQTSAKDGRPVCMWMDGTLYAISEKVGDHIKLRTWLAQ